MIGEIGAESSERYVRAEFEDKLLTARLEEPLLPLWSAVLCASVGRRRPRDASAAGLVVGLLGTGLRRMDTIAVGTGSISRADTPGLRGPVFGGELWRPIMGDSPVKESSGSVTSATECRLV
jgi:hypothetical protein